MSFEQLEETLQNAREHGQMLYRRIESLKFEKMKVGQQLDEWQTKYYELTGCLAKAHTDNAKLMQNNVALYTENSKLKFAAEAQQRGNSKVCNMYLDSCMSKAKRITELEQQIAEYQRNEATEQDEVIYISDDEF